MPVDVAAVFTELTAFITSQGLAPFIAASLIIGRGLWMFKGLLRAGR